jgi:undecaprenyl diphosphate synthase
LSALLTVRIEPNGQVEPMQQDGVPALHVGIIMDGNGRWAQARGLDRIAGHARGARRVSEIVRVAPDLGIGHLTLYAFSTENWQRPLSEVQGLMRIFAQYIRAKTEGLRRHDVRVRFIGMRHRVPSHLGRLMDELESATRDCRGLQLTIAIDYGGRDELTRAVRALSARVAAGELAPESLTEAAVASALDTAGQPEPDLIIRTSGEVRISNFMLWQGIYAEYDFTPVTWPDFSVEALADCVEAFRSRQRRFGGVDTAPAPALSRS